jgi:hypothetical protein
MQPAQAWKILDIAPGSDVATIKRAYAAKLKAIDPDQQVEEFIRLRAAFELARQLSDRDARPVLPADAGLDAQCVDSSPQDAPTSKPPTTANRRGVRPAEPIAAPARDPRADIAELLWNSADPAPGAVERAALALLHHSAMDNVDFANETETWLARLAVETIPRADAILPLLEAHFGWRRFDDMVRLDPAIAGALQRLKDVEAEERLRSPMHRWHFFYMTLRKPAPAAIPRRDFALYRESMGAMLDSLRFHNPGLLRSLDRDHVRLWENAIARQRIDPATPRSDGISWFGWLVGGAILANIVALAS